MHRSAHFSPARWGALAALVWLPAAGFAQPSLVRQGDRWERIYSGSMPATARLRINGHGPVTVEAGVSREYFYTVKVAVRARSEALALRRLAQFAVRLEPQGDLLVLTVPGGVAMSTVSLKAPRLSSAVISTSDGPVQAMGIAGSLEVNSGAGELVADRIGGDCRLLTGGGDIRAGQVEGSLRATTGAGRIFARMVRGEAVIETNGGNVDVTEAGGQVWAQTGGGDIRVGSAGGPVTVTTGGGQIQVGKAGGIVTARNMAGPVQVGEAPGVHCESGSGGIRLNNISGAMRVSTSLGNIMAALLSGKFEDSILATGNGDVTVIIPSNVGVNIRAQNDLADTLRRITTDYRTITVRRQGRQLVGEGPVNGGGPLLQISASVGTIFIRKQ